MKTVGFCMGASSISMVMLEKTDNKINYIHTETKAHNGNAREVLTKLYKNNNIGDCYKVAVTGRKFINQIKLSSISEPEAVEIAYKHLKPKYNQVDAIVSAGGETFLVYELDKNGEIVNVHTGNKCASGTGEFFLQQIKRMNLTLNDAMKTEKAEPYKVSGRCSVFCKSDCTHALNKGIDKRNVVAGLSKMMASKILELLKRIEADNILLIGGTSKNHLMVQYLKEDLENIIIAEESPYFEALGVALWAFENNANPIKNLNELIMPGKSSFSFLPAINKYIDKVDFKTMSYDQANPNDRCIIGLDVGSTTTKAIILRVKDDAILGSVYLRTNGNPIEASKQCYKELYNNIDKPINIVGLGVTGSGRQIAGLHALTNGVINEIIAHAAAAVYFDSEVDTIFEIGGQDAKYTFITNKVASDYAMNEACSAGTGSFLEEAAKESMGIDTLEIAEIALKADNPPNFNDQCAAFISSDIKTAIQEGITKEDIVAGLVYSICQNYSNRVKGNRAIGKKIFMQGGVCYNKAVPIAMAAFTGQNIIVPPEPGLMGAFGVALEIKNKISLGLIEEQNFYLQELMNREAIYGKSFICNGGKEKCDRKCKINMIEINAKKYPFGGSCNKYVNEIRDISYDVEKLDLVVLREKLIFEKYASKQNTNRTYNNNRIGIIKSLLTNSLYPLYYNFFTTLGLDVILADTPNEKGINKQGASFCYPVQLSHSFAQDLLDKGIDLIFMPHVKGINVNDNKFPGLTCPLVQGEPYYLKTAFKNLKKKTILSPVLNFSKGYDKMEEAFIKLGERLGFTHSECAKAYKFAVNVQKECFNEMQIIGKKVLENLKNTPSKIGIVLFGRPYNAYTKDANMGIPHKFASRGYMIIPMDFLDYGKEQSIDYMYWNMGQIIMRTASLVKKHPQLFAAYITNFSCGPDSFLIGYFRKIMGGKPSLTLELDSHTSDAGVDTRIEAFLDVVISYIEINNGKSPINKNIEEYTPAQTMVENNTFYIIDSQRNKHTLYDKNVHVLIPSMGDIGARCLASTFEYSGINATSAPPPAEKELKLGRANSSCKECLPLMLTVGSLMDYLKNRKDNNELLVYFMPEASGPCRFGQYKVLMHNLIERGKIKNVALMSLSAANSYVGLGIKFQTRAWQSVIISDIMDDIYSAILVLSKDTEYALTIYHEATDKIIDALASESWNKVKKVLIGVANKLKTIPLKTSLHESKKVGLVGEIYVRRDGFSRQYLVERLAKKDILVKTAPVSEWIYYCDYLLKNPELTDNSNNNNSSKLKTIISNFYKLSMDKTIKNIFSRSRLYEPQIVDIQKVVENVSGLISPKLTGEAILTIGTALTEIIDEVSGVIAIGPFGCMPNRISEAIISASIDEIKPKISSNNEFVSKVLKKHPSLPFLAIESDGNIFPQVIEARLEAFCLQVEKVHKTMKSINIK